MAYAPQFEDVVVKVMGMVGEMAMEMADDPQVEDVVVKVMEMVGKLEMETAGELGVGLLAEQS